LICVSESQAIADGEHLDVLKVAATKMWGRSGERLKR